MQIINPSTILPLVYLIQDHTDTNTYYVRSVIKDSRSGSVLKTVDLTDNGDRRFTGTFSVPAAEETYIDITTTVYSDSGYTTKAPDKYEENSQYLVKTQWGLQFGGQGGGISERIDYKKIGNMIVDAISKIEKAKEYDDSLVLKSLNGLKQAISDIKMPDLSGLKPIPVNFTPVLEKLGQLEQKFVEIHPKLDEIYHKEFPEPEMFDYERIIQSVESIKSAVSESIKQIENNIDKKESIIKDVLPKIRASLTEVENLVALPDYEKENEGEKMNKVMARVKNLMGKK